MPPQSAPLPEPEPIPEPEPVTEPPPTPQPEPTPEPKPIPPADPPEAPLLPEPPPIPPQAPVSRHDVASLGPSNPQPVETAGSPATLLRAVLILSCAVTGLLGFVGGYWLGIHSHPPAETTVSSPAAAPTIPKTSVAPDPEIKPAPPIPSPPVESPPATPPVPPVETPPVPPSPTPDQSQATPESPPLKILAAPEAALNAFLAAPDWQARAKHVLHADRLLEEMETYYKDFPDGPTVPLSLKQDASLDDPEKGARLITYLVATQDAPEGIPVAIVQTDAGWKIDWETFVEFRDDHFRRFAAGEGSDTGAFHLLVRNTHYFGAPFPGSDQLTAFRIDPPRQERTQYAFVPTGSDLHKALAASTEWGHPCAPVLQLARKEHPDGKSHLEIVALVAPNWRPRE